MSILTTEQKNTLYSQIKSMGTSITASMLKETVSQYDNLTLEELRPHISEELYNQTLQLLCNPQSIQDWRNIETLKHTAGDNINIWREIVSKLNAYIAAYKDDRYSKISDANTLLPIATAEVSNLEARAAMQAEWNMVDKSNYQALKRYVETHPSSPFVTDAFKKMWVLDEHNNEIATLRQFAELMRQILGAGADRFDVYVKVKEKINELQGPANEWDSVDKDDIFEVHHFLKSHPRFSAAQERFDRLKLQELDMMIEERESYSRVKLQLLLEERIFNEIELIQTGLATPESIHKIMQAQMSAIDMSTMSCSIADEGCTDVYFFGVPGTGKTCLLMGLIGANGSSLGGDYVYSVNLGDSGGQYAMALDTFVRKGQTPPPTKGNFTSAINMTITDNKKHIQWPVNLIDMAGEAFLYNLAINPDNANLADMGLGVIDLLTNRNKKIFFFIVDPTKDFILDPHTGREVAQSTIINRFIDLVQSPGNAEIMKNVLAVHFIVTKADRLSDDAAERTDKAADILSNAFGGAVQSLKKFCSSDQGQHINQKDNYRVKCFPFTIGKFYLGGVFSIQRDTTLDLVRTIQMYAAQRRASTTWDKIVGSFNKGY